MTGKIVEGTMPFMGYETYYRIVDGEPEKMKGLTDDAHAPLLLLHGGPGSTHNYMELLDELADTGRKVISYDQIGCGNSYVEGHPELWRMETWINELKSLLDYLHIDRCHIMGQSWGGMLLLQYLVDREDGMKAGTWKGPKVLSAVLSSTLSSSRLWAREQHRMIRFLPMAEQEAIRDAEETGNFDTPECQAATDHYMMLHCAGPYTADDPECLIRPKKAGTESYVVGWGNNEYSPSGTLKDYDLTDRLKEIQVPCLLMSGTDDLCTPYVAKTMSDRIPHSRWHLFQGARHMCFADSHEEYCEEMRSWMKMYSQI
ncbi:MAG: proline iminopeptidase-family hydrolase [Lachnospiraceae bacterium]|nr:proline iminopeptidase-family hydrolase [Lachnospiraceae bacterium]